MPTSSALLNGISKLGSQAGNSFRGLWNAEAAEKATQAVSQNILPPSRTATVASTVSKPFVGMFKAGWKVASVPFLVADRWAGRGFSHLGNFFANRPKTAWGLTAVAAAVGINRIVRGSPEERTQREFQEKIAQTQVMMQQAQAQAPMAQANTSTITAEDMAAMNARMKQGGNAQGFGAAVQAERAQGAAATPAV